MTDAEFIKKNLYTFRRIKELYFKHVVSVSIYKNYFIVKSNKWELSSVDTYYLIWETNRSSYTTYTQSLKTAKQRIDELVSI